MIEYKELSQEEEDVYEKNLVWFFGNNDDITSKFLEFLKSHELFFMDNPTISKHLNTETIINDELTTYFERQQGHQLPRYNYFFFEGFKKVWTYYLRKLILNRVNAQFNDASKTIIIKESQDIFGSFLITSCFPKSRLLILLDEENYFKKPLNKIEKGKNRNLIQMQQKRLENQKRVLMKAYESCNDNLKLLIRIENLIKDSKGELKKLYKFLGINIDEIELESIAKIVDAVLKFNSKNSQVQTTTKLRNEELLDDINDIRF